ncbi:hypothetical protein TGAMA5MH_01170 [Trichoderma gamsii]|uniref:Fungal cellulose binding domain-containing protein n=1 Tax=Trichoderma gamsii TaxID=398673 RepID=A0A2K0TPB6_9HYPO|nr:hypothetical protein TGAMA5MH_01170 [Trichoderma gamsii]
MPFICFNYTGGAQPSVSAPLGLWPGATSAHGENWVDFLTVTYNASVFFSYDLAVSGATLDNDIVAASSTSIASVKQQIVSQFIPGYVSPITVPKPPKWTGSNTLFTIWVGINDIGATFGKGSASTASINQQLISEYTSLVEQLYAAGARNFVFITVPTIDRSPGTIAAGTTVAGQEKIDVVQWNQLLFNMAKSEKALHTDSNIWIYDANALFTEILNNVKSFPQTAGITNTTHFCQAYANGTPTDDYLDPSCGVPVNQYFWLNSLHPRTPVHDVIADVLSRELLAGPNIC